MGFGKDREWDLRCYEARTQARRDAVGQRHVLFSLGIALQRLAYRVIKILMDT
jgi:hypothetical protein